MRSLGPDEAVLWARVMASVKPLRGVVPPPASKPEAAVAKPGPPKSPKPSVSARLAKSVPVPLAVTKAKPQGPGTTLDGGWDRRIARGIVSPDSTIDLHGHTLASAHSMLDHGLEQAIARGDRVLLLVTGKPPRPESERPHARGAIRAAVADWLAASRHADRIAAVRNAHPRHGGAGALYIVLRRHS